MNIKGIYYTVAKVDMPEWETGSITDLETYRDLLDAIKEYDRLNELNGDNWYEIKILLVRGD